MTDGLRPLEDTGPEREPTRKGVWWKSLVASWLILQGIAVVMFALGVDIPDELGFPALVVLWAALWVIWRRRSRADGPQRSLFAPGALGVMQRVFVPICVGIILIGYVVLILDTEYLTRTDVPAGVIAVAVGVIGLVSLVGGRIGVPRLDVSDPARLVRSYRSRLFARLAWAEAPALLAFAGFLLLGGQAWVFGIGLVASLAGFALAAPTRASVRREQERLAASGSSVDLVEVLGVEADTGHTTGT